MLWMLLLLLLLPLLLVWCVMVVDCSQCLPCCFLLESIWLDLSASLVHCSFKQTTTEPKRTLLFYCRFIYFLIVSYIFNWIHVQIYYPLLPSLVIVTSLSFGTYTYTLTFCPPLYTFLSHPWHRICLFHCSIPPVFSVGIYRIGFKWNWHIWLPFD